MDALAGASCRTLFEKGCLPFWGVLPSAMVETIPLSKKSVYVLEKPHRELHVHLRNARPFSFSTARAPPRFSPVLA